jgi:hypothetical protein
LIAVIVWSRLSCVWEVDIEIVSRLGLSFWSGASVGCGWMSVGGFLRRWRSPGEAVNGCLEIEELVNHCWSLVFGFGLCEDARAGEAAHAAPAAADVLATAEPRDGTAEWCGDSTLSFLSVDMCITLVFRLFASWDIFEI